MPTRRPVSIDKHRKPFAILTLGPLESHIGTTMAQAKRVIPIERTKRGPKPGTGYAGRGGRKREIKGKISAELADRVDRERAAYDDMSVAQYLTGVLNAFYEAGLDPKWTKRQTK
jgi:hypothetical protein